MFESRSSTSEINSLVISLGRSPVMAFPKHFINDNSALSLRRLETEAQRLGPIFTFRRRQRRAILGVSASGGTAGEKTPLIARFGRHK